MINQASKTILIVEDDQDIGEIILEVILGETNHYAYVVTDAYIALEMAHKMPPDLFLLDYQLPDMTGLQLLDRLHACEKLKNIPTIIMSANLPWEELVKRNIIGLAKPFDLDVFLRLIQAITAIQN